MDRKFKCYDCGHEFTVPHGVRFQKICPQCQSQNVHRHPDDRGRSRRGNPNRGQRRCP